MTIFCFLEEETEAKRKINVLPREQRKDIPGTDITGHLPTPQM